jgi:hypothetical protein
MLAPQSQAIQTTCVPAVARDPDDRPLDAGVQLAAALVLGEEGGQLGQQGHRDLRISRLAR